jgi:NAD+ synthase/NAD+ synthase (glutamine-hydrolysing)
MDLSRIALLQINSTPGDLDGNCQRIEAALAEAQTAGAKLALTPELALLGYPPRDLLFRHGLLERADALTLELARRAAIPLILGTAWRRGGPGRPFTNGARLLENGAIRAEWGKELLPSYDVFDEGRYFEPSMDSPVVEISGTRFGVTICEDLWVDPCTPEARPYTRDPAQRLVQAGAQVILNLSASPYAQGKPAQRRELVRSTARRLSVPVALCNLVGGCDDIIFDGNSMLVDERGVDLARGPHCDSGVVMPGKSADATSNPADELRSAIVLGLRDYVDKCGFPGVLLGLSGGIDSALCAALAVDALGPARVRGVALPSRFSSDGSRLDAFALSAALGIRCDELSIEPLFTAALASLGSVLPPHEFGLTEENLQARLRGVLLMAMSNETQFMLLSTGNKSELATGYCTLYGDMCGGLAPIADLWKTEVYALARHYAAKGLIPENSMTKAPSAELRAGQTDQDSLPPYDVLDAILRLHVEHGLGVLTILERLPALSRGVVERVLLLVATSEYKRRQAAPGLKVSAKAFGVGRRIPLVGSRRAFLDRGP